MANSVTQGDNPRLDLYKQLLADKTPGIGDRVKLYTFEQFEKKLLTEPAVQQGVGTYLGRKGIVASQDDFVNQYLQPISKPKAAAPAAAVVPAPPAAPPAYKPVAGGVPAGVAAPISMSVRPLDLGPVAPSPGVRPPSLTEITRQQMVTPMAPEAPVEMPMFQQWENQAEIEQAAKSPVFKAYAPAQAVMDDRMAMDMGREAAPSGLIFPTKEAERQFAKLSQKEKEDVLYENWLTRQQRKGEKAKKERIPIVGTTVELVSQGGKLFDNMIDHMLAGETLLRNKLKTALTFGDKYEKALAEERKARIDINNWIDKVDKIYQGQLAASGISTSVTEAIDNDKLDELPEAIGYNVAMAAGQIIPSLFTAGYAMYAQTLPDAYKSGVEEIARKTKRTPEQVISDGDDAFVVANLSAGLQGALERVSGGIVSKSIASKGGYKWLRDNIIQETGKKSWSRAAGVTSALATQLQKEGIIESAQEVVGVAGEQLAASDSAAEFYKNLNESLSNPETKKRIRESYYGGMAGAGGLIVGGKAIGKGYKRFSDYRRERKRAVEEAAAQEAAAAPVAEEVSDANYKRVIVDSLEEVPKEYRDKAIEVRTGPMARFGGGKKQYVYNVPLETIDITEPAAAPPAAAPVVPAEEEIVTEYEPVTQEEFDNYMETGTLDEARQAGVDEDVYLIEKGEKALDDIEDPLYKLIVADQLPEAAAEEGTAKPVAPVIAPLNIDFTKNEGRNVNYQGIAGRIKIDSDGAPYVFTKDGDVVYIEGGLSGQTPQQLGVQPLADDVINEADVETVLQDENAPLDQNQLEYDFDNNTITLYGKPFTYEGVETNSKGQTTALRLRDANGKVKFVRNEDTILEFEIQKELYEKSRTNKPATIESATAAAQQLQVVPVARIEQVPQQVQQEGPVGDIEGDEVVAAAPVEEAAPEAPIATTMDSKGRVSRFFKKEETKSDGTKVTTFQFERSDKGGERFTAVTGVPLNEVIGDQWQINENDIPPGAKPTKIVELREANDGRVAATVVFENEEGLTSQGEVTLTPKPKPEAPAAPAPKGRKKAAPVTPAPAAKARAVPESDIERQNTFTREDLKTISEGTALARKGKEVMSQDRVASTLRVGDEVTFFAEKERKGVWNGKEIIEKGTQNPWGIMGILADANGFIRNDTKINEQKPPVTPAPAGPKKGEAKAEPGALKEFTSTQSSEITAAFDKAKTSKGFDKKYGKGAYKALSDITKNFEDIMDNLSGKIKQDCL